ncbi:MAG: phosphoribosylglycinamide formyltransferase 1 [Thermosediminibacterales bacterium]|nr:phosphoribosylglycinamide formyltransferase 1 [Thermosediminibacterales bacterium]MDK2835319.1 phosphoribosylglycinamide formyltransferase 1 [Thermosediminibacterales bacterium]
MSTFKLGVLVSGGGTNLQAIIDSINSKKLNAEIAVVISSRKDAFALKRARKHNIPEFYIGPDDYESPAEYEKAMIKVLQRYKVDLVVLAGFMKVLTSEFIEAFRNRIMNIHPSLIPSFCGRGFYGKKVHKAALDYGVKVTGVTVHFVDEGTDTGPIILQEAVPVMEDDTVDTLAERVLKVEHRLYPEAIKLFIEGRLRIEGRKVKILK